MKIKTSELTGAALDWAVSKADNPPGKEGGMDWWERDDKGYLFDPLNECTYSPSTNWAQGGTILEREGIWLRGPNNATKPDGTVVLHIDFWYAHKEHTSVQNGPTPLIAAMRCYCCAKLGDIVDVPEELCQQQSS